MKEKRQQIILQKLRESGWLTVKDMSDDFGVSEMTIRRDLVDLEEKNLIKRLHGGARICLENSPDELSHEKKKLLNVDLKEDIAQKIAENINDGELVFLGAGTTIELSCKYLANKRIKIITNSLPIFMGFKDDESKEVILIGGNFRHRTNSFVGTSTIDALKKYRVQKAFIGVNAIEGNIITNYNESEGLTQRQVLDNAQIKYIVADHTKLDKVDFYHFYDLSEVDYLIVDNNIDSKTLKRYEQIVKVI